VRKAETGDAKVSQIVPEDILQATSMYEEELRQEIAVVLFQKEKLTLARATGSPE
jgi:predicted HTH domain antitoxin